MGAALSMVRASSEIAKAHHPRDPEHKWVQASRNFTSNFPRVLSPGPVSGSGLGIAPAKTLPSSLQNGLFPCYNFSNRRRINFL
jgi:hypothetical protein